MVYIRAKTIQSEKYLYLVKSVWDSKKNTSRQQTIKYLGKASLVVSDDIPVDYRNDSKILSALSKYAPDDIEKRNTASEKTGQKLYKKIIEGDIQGSSSIFEEYVKIFKTVDFFDKILKPVMSKVGSDWESGKISVGTEHVASNIAQTLVKGILEQVNVRIKKKKILICVPVGEEHHLGCDVLETYLSMNGFKVFNLGTSIPTESILDFIEQNNPDLVLLSITIDDNLKSGQRLVRKISKESNVPILVGGLAVQGKNTPKFDGEIIGDLSLNDIKKKIGREING
jgi:methanogenic corrinoid protein MtbC1|tara:strand:+ start:277 stop:1128 length:852 start_codon:yes stop_codon:yes gene_type:complete